MSSHAFVNLHARILIQMYKALRITLSDIKALFAKAMGDWSERRVFLAVGRPWYRGFPCVPAHPLN